MKPDRSPMSSRRGRKATRVDSDSTSSLNQYPPILPKPILNTPIFNSEDVVFPSTSLPNNGNLILQSLLKKYQGRFDEAISSNDENTKCNEGKRGHKRKKSGDSIQTNSQVQIVIHELIQELKESSARNDDHNKPKASQRKFYCLRWAEKNDLLFTDYINLTNEDKQWIYNWEEMTDEELSCQIYQILKEKSVVSQNTPNPSRSVKKYLRETKESEEMNNPLQAPKKSEDGGLTWKDMFFEMVIYKLKYGDCLVPSDYAEQNQLGQWVLQMRNQYREYNRNAQARKKESEGDDTDSITTKKSVKSKKKKNFLPFQKLLGTPDQELRIKALQSLDFIWDLRDAIWDDHYRKLEEFHREHGHCNVPTNKSGHLGRWVNEMRVMYQQMKTNANKSHYADWRLKPERLEKLNRLGFTWKLKDRTDWDFRYQELKEYKEMHGNTNVPQHYSENRPLGKWVAKQRYQYGKLMRGLTKDVQINQSRIDKLNELDFDWGRARDSIPGTQPSLDVSKL